MSPIGRALTALLGCLALALVFGAASASAATLRAGESANRDCAGSRLAAGTPGVALHELVADADGYLTVQLRGGDEPDWDLAVFEQGDLIGSSTSFTSTERTGAFVERGDSIVVQACRLSGSDESVEVATDLFELDLTEPAPGTGDAITQESVTLGDGSDLQRLERLGFDVGHDVTGSTATVTAYSDAERRRLDARGFDSMTVVEDVAAADAADRAAEAAAVAAPGDSTLPSTREEYRTYTEFTSEMKALAAANPTLVRSIEIGRSFEDRAIEGVEIAVGVNRTDDGRPVFLDFGAHHAREWPSAELPMEFALDLVRRFNAGDARVVSLLQNVRVVVVPIVNPDGYVASRDAPGNGPNPAIDDDENLTLGLSLANQGAYRRKNCNVTTPGLPCAVATFQGVDLNRNYGAYYGGPGSSTDPTSQGFRGAGPFSEDESEAVHQYTAGIHPTVFITNHTFTDGRWLRQPGFDAPFLPQVPVPGYTAATCPGNADTNGGAISPDETAMNDLGDAMATASGYISELGYESLCDITGATEDWNYFSQGTYGYTPEIRGPNFHANYATMVVGEYPGMRDAYLIAAERAGTAAEHSIIEGTMPANAFLTLRKEFDTPTCEDATCAMGNGPSFPDVLETTLTSPASGDYQWHVNPSGRPLAPGETYTMTCTALGGTPVSRQVTVARGQRVTVDWTPACGPRVVAPGGGGGGSGDPGNPGGGGGSGGGGSDARDCVGKTATIVGTGGSDKLKGTRGNDVFDARGGDDLIRGGGGNDRVCARGGDDTVKGGSGNDRLRAGAGDDSASGGGGNDQINGGGGDDRCRGGGGKNRLRSC